MPNDCWNNITIICDTENTLDNLFSEYFKEKLNNEKQLEDFEKGSIELKLKGPSGIILKLWSAWQPDYDLLNSILDKYNVWIKNTWEEEGGDAGVFIGYKDDNNNKQIKDYRWKDMCLEEKYLHFYHK